MNLCSEAFAEQLLTDSLQQLLTGLEDLGVESIPPEMEEEMRRAMSMSPHPAMDTMLNMDSAAMDSMLNMDSATMDTMLNMDSGSESLASSVFASQFGTPYGLSPAEEVAFSTMIQQMMVVGGDTDPMIEHIMWSTEPQWETDVEAAENVTCQM